MRHNQLMVLNIVPTVRTTMQQPRHQTWQLRTTEAEERKKAMWHKHLVTMKLHQLPQVQDQVLFQVPQLPHVVGLVVETEVYRSPHHQTRLLVKSNSQRAIGMQRRQRRHTRVEVLGLAVDAEVATRTAQATCKLFKLQIHQVWLPHHQERPTAVTETQKNQLLTCYAKSMDWMSKHGRTFYLYGVEVHQHLP